MILLVDKVPRDSRGSAGLSAKVMSHSKKSDYFISIKIIWTGQEGNV